MKISRPKHIGIILSFVFAIVALGVLVVSVWLALERNKDYLDVRDKLGAIEAQAKRIDALTTRWRSVEEEAKSIEKAFVRRDKLEDFLVAIEDTAANASVAEAMSIFEDKQNEITLRLRVSGPFQNVFTFVAHLNVLPNLLFLERVDFSQGAAVIADDADAKSTANYATAEVIIRVPLQIVEAVVID